MMRRSVCVAQDEFERLAGPVKTAQNNAKLANQAYTAAELKLAKAETTAERLGNNPKLQKEAMARIHKLQEAARRMDELVRCLLDCLILVVGVFGVEIGDVGWLCCV